MNCQICGKAATQAGMGRHLHSGKWRHRGPVTKKTIKPNLQKWQGMMICSRCLRTLGKSMVKKKAAEPVKSS